MNDQEQRQKENLKAIYDIRANKEFTTNLSLQQASKAKIFFQVTERIIFENIIRMKSILSWLIEILISINGQP